MNVIPASSIPRKLRIGPLSAYLTSLNRALSDLRLSDAEKRRLQDEVSRVRAALR
jgi:hypothetical protein